MDPTVDIVEFVLGGERYALDIQLAREIVEMIPITPIPRAPSYISGVINLRGRVIPVVDIGKRLFGRALEPTPVSRIVVAEGVGGAVGLSVDAASEVATVDPVTVMPAPETTIGAETIDAFDGVVEHEGRLVILLDLDKALPRTEYESTIGDAVEGDEDV